MLISGHDQTNTLILRKLNYFAVNNNMYVVLRLLLNITHFLFIVYYFLQEKCVWLILTIKQCTFLNKDKCNYSIINLRNHLIATSKFPTHLAILLGQEEISIIDLVKLISWCIIAEIPYVSFYDHKGRLQKHQIDIRNKLNELEPNITQNIEWTNFPSCKITNSQRVNDVNQFKNKSCCARVIDTNTNNALNKHKTRIQVFSSTDCKSKIVSLTKNLARTIDVNILQVNDITPELLNKELSAHVQMPDPDVAIVFGKTLCTYGFMPWQTRVTEFFVLPTHHGISSNNFVETLIKYSKCEQRFGK